MTARRLPYVGHRVFRCARSMFKRSRCAIDLFKFTSVLYSFGGNGCEADSR
jgi:hypothetical protein